MKVKALIHSMRLRTLPLSLAGVVCGGLLAQGAHGYNWWAFALVLLTACALQVLTNLSNEMGDHLSGVDGEGREGPNYSMTDGGLTVKQMWRAINAMVVVCAVSGLAMLLFSFHFSIFNFQFASLLALGAAAIWAATHYTLGKKPYGYIGLGDLFVFIFFGLVSVLGSYYVIAHTLPIKIWLWAPAVGVGLLSVAVLNVNNIRDMQSDEGIRKTIPLRIGERAAKWYQTVLVVLGVACFCCCKDNIVLCVLPTAPFFLWHIIGVWRRKGRKLDKMLPLLVISTFVLAFLYSETFYIENTAIWAVVVVLYVLSGTLPEIQWPTTSTK
ncbi:MAG: 1,4-dihydroxy-2-naphthoate octaprenyltransferase [Bacteroidales bacterium]|nr:1,4-dihydroxy-2-naphthoate octaprenyltransferase [Bacteroidales bacterium]